MDISSLVSSLPALIGMLPLVMQVTQLVFQLFFIWFFGSVSMRGYRGNKTTMLKISGILFTGALCFFASASFAGFVPFFSSGIFSMLQLDMAIAGIVVSLVMAGALSLMTHQQSAEKAEETIQKLMRKVAALEDMLKNKKAHLTETEAKSLAQKAMEGFKALGAKMIGNDYEVSMSKGEEKATVVLDMWDGEVKMEMKHEAAILQFLKDPEKVAGLVIIAIIAISAAILFEGFPNPMDDIASMFGMSADELGDLTQSMADSPLLQADIPEGCVSPMVFTSYYSQLQDKDFLLDHVYENEAVAETVRQNCGDPDAMIMVEHEGKEIVIALIMSEAKVAYLTDGVFCMCVDAGA